MTNTAQNRLTFFFTVAVAACGGSETPADTGNADAGTGADAGPSDTGPADTGGPTDMGADAGPADTGLPPLTNYRLILDGEEIATQGTNLQLCVHEYPELPCAQMTPLQNRVSALIRVPSSERFHFKVTDPTGFYANLLVPIRSRDPDGNLGWIISTSAQIEAITQTASVSADDTGAILFLISSPSFDPEAVAGSTIESPTGQVVYLTPDSLPDPTLNAASAGGEVVVVGAETGTHTMRFMVDKGTCNPGFGAGWPADGVPDSVEALVLPGFTMLFALDCPDIEGRAAIECDLVDQDCGPMMKCRTEFFTDVDGNFNSGTRCVGDEPMGGGDACSRVDDEAGNDDCSAGNYCAFWGLPQSQPQARQCFALCYGNDDCGADQYCLGFSAGPTSGGSCVDRCDPFGSDCGPGNHCALIRTTSRDRGQQDEFVCQFVGGLAEGGQCANSRGCAAGLSCALGNDLEFRCRQPCDENNGCAAGQQCTPANANTASGVCI